MRLFIREKIRIQKTHEKKEGGRQTKNIWLAHNKTNERRLKSINTLNLELVKTPDILEQISNCDLRPKLVIGFAAETDELECNAKKKLESKNCDWILANDVNINSGVMGKLDTKIILFSNRGKKIFPQMSKADFSDLLAKEICEVFE